MQRRRQHLGSGMWPSSRRARGWPTSSAENNCRRGHDVRDRRRPAADELRSTTIVGAKYASLRGIPRGPVSTTRACRSIRSIPPTRPPGLRGGLLHRVGSRPARSLVHARPAIPPCSSCRGLARRPLAVADQYCGLRAQERRVSPTCAGTRDLRPFAVGMRRQVRRVRLARHVSTCTPTTVPRAGACSRSIRREPELRDWREIVPQRDTAVLEELQHHRRPAGARLARERLERHRAARRSTASRARPRLPGIGTSDGLGGEPEDDDVLLALHARSPRRR